MHTQTQHTQTVPDTLQHIQQYRKKSIRLCQVDISALNMYGGKYRYAEDLLTLQAQPETSESTQAITGKLQQPCLPRHPLHMGRIPRCSFTLISSTLVLC